MAIPVLPREGGLLLAVPLKFFSDDSLLHAGLGVDDALLLGPSKEFSANLIQEDDGSLPGA